MAGLLLSIQNLAGTLKLKGQNVLDGLFPPEKRAELFARLQAFAVENPKLSAFLVTHLALTGLPLVMFVVFTITVFVFSLVAALLVALLVALLFTAFMVGLALLVVLPTVFLTTMGATFLFLWGLGGYYIVKWFNDGEASSAQGNAIGDKLNSLTGGRMGFLMDGARKTEASKESNKESNAESNKEPSKESNGSADQAVSAVTQGADVGNVTSQAEKTVGANGVKKRVGSTASTPTSTVSGAKGAVGGATGLA